MGLPCRSKHHGQRLLTLSVACCVLPASVMAEQEPNFAQRFEAQFKASDIKFGSAKSKVPFPPIATLGSKHYTKALAKGPNSEQLEYDVDSYRQAAGIPAMLGPKDLLVVGEYLSWTEFNVLTEGVESFEIASIGLPLGWLRQLNPDWQLATFVMPFGHYTMLPKDDYWNWQYLGGIFTRYVQSDSLWWAFGFYADIADNDEDFYTPYVGASWAINAQWTLSAILPWPSLSYAPTSDWLIRLGASPSAASWSIDLDEADANMNLDAWDFGLSVEYRFHGNFWLSAEAGAGGFRALRFSDSEVEEVDVDFSEGAFFGINIKYRPAL